MDAKDLFLMQHSAVHTVAVGGNKASAAERVLNGLSDEIDGLVLQWSSLTAEDRTDVEQTVALGSQLLELVRPAPLPAVPQGGDSF